MSVKSVDFLLKFRNWDGHLGEKTLGSQLFDLLILDFTEKQVLFHIGELIMEIIRQIIPEEFLEEKTLHFREDIDAALLAVEGFELPIVARLVPFFFHQE